MVFVRSGNSCQDSRLFCHLPTAPLTSPNKWGLQWWHQWVTITRTASLAPLTHYLSLLQNVWGRDTPINGKPCIFFENDGCLSKKEIGPIVWTDQVDVKMHAGNLWTFLVSDINIVLTPLTVVSFFGEGHKSCNEKESGRATDATSKRCFIFLIMYVDCFHSIPFACGYIAT